uniref:Uncharacterized protein n=1 Tax=Anguilla anguilla TaxID=7936 RepID=A0A0E9UB45_ANGAN
MALITRDCIQERKVDRSINQ